MKLTRRNALIGLGAIAAGGGALFGSGAFSQVEADRTMTVSFSGDSSAELTLNDTSTYATTTTGTNGQNVLELQFSNLNDDAVSTFSGVFEITNNDSQGNSHDVYIKNAGDVDGTKIDFQDSGGTSIVGSGQAQTLTSGGTISVQVVIDSTNTISSSVTVSVVAN